MEIDGAAEMGAGTAAARPDAHREVARGDDEQGECSSTHSGFRSLWRNKGGVFAGEGHTPLHTTHAKAPERERAFPAAEISSAVPLQHLAVLHCRSTGHPQRGERRGAGSWRRAHSCWSSATSRSRLPAAWCRWICAQITLARVSQPVGMRLVAAIEWVLGGRAAGPWHGRGRKGGGYRVLIVALNSAEEGGGVTSADSVCRKQSSALFGDGDRDCCIEDAALSQVSSIVTGCLVRSDVPP